MNGSDENTNILLRRWEIGDADAGARLLRRFYDELRGMAAAQLAREQSGHTLQATALVNEALLRLCGETTPNFESRRHFFGSAARAMREVLVDHARRKKSEKRGGDMLRVQIEELLGVPATDDIDLMALDDALRRLEDLDPQQVRVVELRYFMGLSIDDTALAMDLHPSAVNREWAAARAWLLHQLAP